MNTEKLLEDLETLVEASGRIPMTTKRMVEEDEMMRIIDAIQESLPLELEESRRIVAEKDAILADAKKQAEQLIEQAKDYIAKLTSESELVKAAQEQANEIIATANKSSEELRNSSVQYGADVLKYVEGNLEKTLESLRQNRESLRQSARPEETTK
ncbi:MAG: ATPase [Veillonella sp.]|nr:ATPase [Veillonella sp.]MCF0155801.1 ATPase [Veillonella sp.]